MKIIPVIDLLEGKVVRAMRGERDRYQPVRSTLCESCDPVEVASALLGLYPFDSLYIADLDAIQGFGNNACVIQKLLHEFAEVILWLDTGISDPSDWKYHHQSRVRCVVASESQKNIESYAKLVDQLPSSPPTILSLDFNGTGFIGPEGLLDSRHWPSDVICMTLAKVGSYDGPDFERLSTVINTAYQSSVYAAGGIRNLDDLQKLRMMGVTGALIASGLHDGKISVTDIAQLQA